jgi:hypothetical protein
LITRSSLVVHIDGFRGSRARTRRELVSSRSRPSGNRQPKQVASKKLSLQIVLHQSALPIRVRSVCRQATRVWCRTSITNTDRKLLPAGTGCAGVLAGKGSALSMASARRCRDRAQSRTWLAMRAGPFHFLMLKTLKSSRSRASSRKLSGCSSTRRDRAAACRDERNLTLTRSFR